MPRFLHPGECDGLEVGRFGVGRFKRYRLFDYRSRICAQRAELLVQLESQRPVLPAENMAIYQMAQERAMSVLESTSAWEAFLVDEEKPATLARYGDNKFGRSCLVARRLVEAGVAVVTVPWMYLHSTKNFDTHSKHFQLMKSLLLPPVDRAFSALLEDLDERGLLDETLVVWTGEFGRTPKINKNAGRDHWGNVYSTVLAGGGIRGGQAYGTSDVPNRRTNRST